MANPAPQYCPPAATPLTLEAAITALETGAYAGEAVQLTDTLQLPPIQPGTETAALQRLRGHRLLMALAEGQADLPSVPRRHGCHVLPGVQTILDAIA